MLDELNDWLEARCQTLWREIPHGKQPGSIADVWHQERAALMPRPFDGFVEYTKHVTPTCLVHFERNRYSVPVSYANRPVSLLVYAHRLVVVAEGQLVCEHPRIILRCYGMVGATARWWRSWPWFCTTRKTRCWPLSNRLLDSGVPSKTHILNVLLRLLDHKPAPTPVTTPQALRLAVGPQVNALRYDALRAVKEVRHAS